MTALGLNVYEKENKLQPKTTFTWSEIKNIGFDKKKFIIKPHDKNTPNFVFFSQNVRMNELVGIGRFKSKFKSLFFIFNVIPESEKDFFFKNKLKFALELIDCSI